MRLKARREESKRSKQRGTAAIEFALSIAFLAPLVLGIIDYGYYFYVAVTTVEATRLAARQLEAQVVGACGTAAATTASNLAQGSAGAAKVYMSQIGLVSSTTVTATCGTDPGNPTWNVTVEVDFRPAVGFVRAGMNPSTTAGKVEFSQSLYLAGN
jgi:Flp pilus assembly protein TadG